MDFYPRSPCGERLTPARMLSRLLEISIHALLAESDNRGSYHVKRHKNFYPRSPCGERQGHRRCSFCPSNISIHALLAESDRGWGLSPPACTAFLSTLSLRRATPPTWTTGGPMRFLSTLSLRRATRNNLVNSVCLIFLSTLSLRRATSAGLAVPRQNGFLSTLSLRRATQVRFPQCLISPISIHALLAESDIQNRQRGKFLKRFLSTLSLRRATALCASLEACMQISIHALLAESDASRAGTISVAKYFYPRSPCGERHQ